MAGFTAALAAVGVGMQVYGQYKAGQDAAEAAAYNASMFNYQAKIIEDKKALTRREYDRKIRQLEGETVTAIASSGYDMSGSFLEVMNDSLTQAQLDKQKEIYNLDIEKFQAMSSAEQATRQGQMAQSSANIGAMGTLLSEGSSWYTKYGGKSPTSPKPRADYPTSWKKVWQI